MKYLKRLTAAGLSALLIGSLALPAFAEAAPSEKEEVIYIMTDACGSVTDEEVVNIFSGGDITDYGDYSDVKMLNTTDKITKSGDRVKISSDADRVYYQGTLKNAEIPWKISIRYYLDGKEYSAKEIAGKSGALEVHFSIEKNENSKKDFYESYALEASFTLNSDNCKNIVASGATIANVGNKKQLTYTILPGKGIDTVISAEVTDFEMDPVSINGIRLNLDFEVDDKALTEKVDELISAVSKIDSGAKELENGTDTLADATDTLKDKVGKLNSGVGTLAGGTSDLYKGLENITAKNDQLTAGAYTAYEGLCTAAATALNTELSKNGLERVTLTPSNYNAVLTELLKKADPDGVYNKAYQTARDQVTKQVEAQEDALYRGYIEENSASIFEAYVSSNAENLYAQVAAQAVLEDLMQKGYTEEQAAAFLQTTKGQLTVAKTVDSFTDEQKSAILKAAVTSLTDAQKEEILAAAQKSLTEEQKAQIKKAYIEQLMTSDEVTAQINDVVGNAGAATKQIAELKGQLDSYGVFYKGLLDYTKAVSSAATGAETLKIGMDTLKSNTGTLKLSVGKLNAAVLKLYDGTKELKNGTSTLEDKTSTINTQIDDEIDAMVADVCGSDRAVTSFVSDKNTKISSVQFVIKTAAVEKAEETVTTAEKEQPLTFLQKLLRLFGLY